MDSQRRDVEIQRHDMTEAWFLGFLQRRDVVSRRDVESQRRNMTEMAKLQIFRKWLSMRKPP